MAEPTDERVKSKRQRKPKISSKTIPNREFDISKYEIMDRSLSSGLMDEALSIRSTPHLVKFLTENKDVEVDARIFAHKKMREGRRTVLSESNKKQVRLNRNEFLETYKKNNVRLKEDISFSFDGAPITNPANVGLVGDDFVPILGGPFNKQLYIYDYLKMHTQAFYAYHHDPLGRFIINTTRDFTLGRGYRADCKNPVALAFWRAFEEVNQMQDLMNYIAIELSMYGEIMVWKLPNFQSAIEFQLRPGQQSKKALIPRIRLIDPSVIWEIVTYPEDIQRVLFYQWVAPTQYQIYTGRANGDVVSSLKFIYQQIPAQDVVHKKVNVVSNEKRGRSDLMPALGYMKRLRDTVNYGIIGHQKAAAWAIDTKIKGNQGDIDNYILNQQSIGTTAPAGSEFVHTDAIERNYIAAQQSSSRGGQSSIFDWCLSMIAAATGIPVSYFGTHMSGGQTRASALVATEPVAKKFEERQLVYEKILLEISRWYLDMMGFENDEIEFTFPEISTQDRSAKIKDLTIAETEQWLSKERVANMVAKEFNVTDFDYKSEKDIIDKQGPIPQPPAEGGNIFPLTTPGSQQSDKPSSMTSDEKRKVAQNDGF